MQHSTAPLLQSASITLHLGVPSFFPPTLVLGCVPNSAHMEAHEQQFSGIRECGNRPV